LIFDPSPIVFYARGPLADLILELELTEYTDFMAVEHQFIWPSRQVLIALPFSKEQVMLEPALTLLEKRKLTKLLGLAAASALDPKNENQETLADLLSREQVPFESRVFQLIAYGACRCSSLQEVTQLSLKSAVKVLESLRASIHHLGGQCPFILPLWGSSELSQAACRKAAVSSCIQILGKSFEDVQEAQIAFTNKLEKQNLVPCSQKRKAFLLDRPILGINGTALITIPPSSDLNPRPDAPAINILQSTSASNCCPSGTCKY
jgi:RAB protein geranylgeranyltransferase component A